MFIVNWLKSNFGMGCDFIEEPGELLTGSQNSGRNNEELLFDSSSKCKILLTDEMGNAVLEGKNKPISYLQVEEYKNPEAYNDLDNKKNKIDYLGIPNNNLLKANGTTTKINSKIVTNNSGKTLLRILSSIYSSSKIKKSFPLKDKVIKPEYIEEKKIEEENPKIVEEEKLKKLLKHKKNNEKPSKEQKHMPNLRVKSLQILNDIIDKTQNCIFCEQPISENDINFSLLCKHRACFICIYNKLQDIIGGSEPKLLLCACDAIIYLYLLLKDIELESLDLYVEMISEISQTNVYIKSYCPYDLHLSKKILLSEKKICKKCENPYCQKCGLDHPTQTCLEYYNETLKMEIKENLPKCTECNKNPLEIELGCECKLCLICCKIMIKIFLYKENPTNDPVCLKHNICIPRLYIYQAFGGQNSFIKEQDKAIDYLILSPKFSCEICLVDFSVNQSITMDCDHRFCYNCIKSYLNTLMKDSSSGKEIGCPKCNNPISYETLKSNSDPDIFERYLKFTVMAFHPKNDEVMKWCINCDFGCTIPIDEENFICPNCKSEYCPKCNKKHFMSKCEDLKTTLSARDLKAMLGENEDFFTNFMKDYIKCPNCNEAIQKVSGCNFLTCTWPRCNGISFCAICYKVLTKEQHYSHYKVSGPFGGTCNTIDKVCDE